MTNFIQKRLKKLFNTPYKSTEVESEMKRLTTICANLSENDVSQRDSENRGEALNQILQSRRDRIVTKLHGKADFVQQKYYLIRCVCERNQELEILRFLEATGDANLRESVLETWRDGDGWLSGTDDSRVCISQSQAFIVVESTVLRLLLSNLYLTDDFQHSKLLEVSGELMRWFIRQQSGVDDVSNCRQEQAEFLTEIEDQVHRDGVQNYLNAIEIGNIYGALKIAKILMERQA